MRRILGGFGFLAGVSYPLRALGVLRQTPTLWQYLVVPILVNSIVAIALYAGLLLWGWQGITGMLDELSAMVRAVVADLPAWLGFLAGIAGAIGWLLRSLLVIILLVAVGFVLVQFGTLVGSLWYGRLSEQLELVRTGRLQVVAVSGWREVWRSLLFELKKLVLFGAVALLLLAANLLPVVGAIATGVGWLSLTAGLVCLDFLDAPLERRRLRFRQKLGIILRTFPASAGFGLVCLGLVSIPLLNLLTVPLCVTAGTLFFCDRILPKRLLPSSEAQHQG